MNSNTYSVTTDIILRAGEKIKMVVVSNVCHLFYYYTFL